MMILRTVLVVDDVSMMREIIGTVMKSHCKRFVGASSCKEAIECLDQEKDLELVISDLHLGDGDGFDILEAIQARKGPKPLAVLMTARYTDEVADKARTLGAIGVISKPISFKEIEQTWNKELDRRVQTRRLISAPIRIHSRDGSPLVSSRLGNLSLCGAFIETPLPLGSEIKVEILLGDNVMRSNATVVRVQQPSWIHPAGVGVHFEDMDSESKSLLESVLRELPPPEAISLRW